MGRQAKLKKDRRDAKLSPPSDSTPPLDAEPTQFVQQLEQQGYHLQQAIRSPELPDQHVNPKL